MHLMELVQWYSYCVIIVSIATAAQIILPAVYSVTVPGAFSSPSFPKATTPTTDPNSTDERRENWQNIACIASQRLCFIFEIG